jgi:type IV secretion system protein VirB10
MDTPTAAMGDVAPVIALPRQGLPKAALVAIALLVAVVLFVVLDARRRALVQTRDTPPVQTTSIAPPPPLYIPGPAVAVPVQPYYQPVAPVVMPYSVPAPPPVAPRYRPPPYVAPVFTPAPTYDTPPPVYASPRATASGRQMGDSVLVVDTTAAQRESSTAAKRAEPEVTQGAAILGGRARAGMLANRSTTVPQGTLISAVLETGFNSTQPGLARAIISRDVRGFDGSRVLIPRGSRVLGEYSSNASLGQNRAMVNWTSLVRPDGAVIAIGSPAADSVGRGGIRAKVNTHFLQRFSAALLQSVVDVGTSLAGRRSNSSVIIATPGGAQTAASLIQPNQLAPTLSVRPGTSVSIFVARDLDFTGVERLR